MKLEINRARWGRGYEDEGYLLHQDTKKMCCLGFLARNCGLPPEVISGVGAPSDLGEKKFKNPERQAVWDALQAPLRKPRWAVSEEHDANNPAHSMEIVLIRINDSPWLPEAKREKLLTKEFKRIGVEVSFVGESKVGA